jgi:hypothetical protein
MRLRLPGPKALRTTLSETRDIWRDMGLLNGLVNGTRTVAIKEPPGSVKREVMFGFNRGLIDGTPVWQWWKSRHLRGGLCLAF